MCLKYRFKETFNIAKKFRIEGFCEPFTTQLISNGRI